MKKFSKKDLRFYGGLSVAFILIIVSMFYEQKIQAENIIFFPRPLSDQDIKIYSNNDTNAVIIYPLFTQNAYKNGGFYDYFNYTCPTCDKIKIDEIIKPNYVTGLSGFEYLRQLKYNYITDIDVDKNPDILKKYDKIILLHNEYMTQKEFDAISTHKNVIYLYPNSAYVKIDTDYSSMTQKLVLGHGYDETQIPPYPIKTGIASGNGFGYVTSSQFEYDLNCKNYKWEKRPNGIQPTCWFFF